MSFVCFLLIKETFSYFSCLPHSLSNMAHHMALTTAQTNLFQRNIYKKWKRKSDRQSKQLNTDVEIYMAVFCLQPELIEKVLLEVGVPFNFTSFVYFKQIFYSDVFSRATKIWFQDPSCDVILIKRFHCFSSLTKIIAFSAGVQRYFGIKCCFPLGAVIVTLLALNITISLP